jgi:hypothetical protein
MPGLVRRCRGGTGIAVGHIVAGDRSLRTILVGRTGRRRRYFIALGDDTSW